ncbi:MAG TPA: amidohydrolase family protein [Longimicrobiaceae bacterium]|nr:amidohydrolase family protein [Longimicrobiaceae bacterium]
MLTLIENGDVYTPEPVGSPSILLTDGRIAKVGEVDRRAVEALGVECEVVDATDCLVVPGFIDPHQHLLGGSGEKGFSSQTPEFFVSEIVRWGITTVVGVLGVDTTMKTMPGLLAKVKGLKEQGLNAFVWTGGYDVPPTSIMGSVRDDLMFIEEVIGAGEIAISDLRGMDPPVQELARIATDCYVGGMLAGKAGLTHFHVGESDRRLAPLRELLDGYDVQPEWLYATHVERSEKLMREAVELANRGASVDVDTVEEDLPKWLRFYLDEGGDPERITASSDAGTNSPRVLYEQVRRCVVEEGFPMEQALSLVTRNTARTLKLQEKGVLEKGRMGDVVLLEKGTLEIVHVLSRGVFMVRDGSLAVQDRFLEGSNREIHLRGEKLDA